MRAAQITRSGDRRVLRLAPAGRMVGVAFDSPSGMASIALSAAFGARRIRTFVGEPPTDSLAGITRFVEENAIRALVHGTFPLTRIQDALHVSETQALHGKIVITTAA